MKPYRYRPRHNRLPVWTWFGIAGAGVAATYLAMGVPVGNPPYVRGASAKGAPTARGSDKSAPAAQEQASVVRTIDGDTLDLDGVRVRIWGIDAPDKPASMKAAARKRAAAIIASEGVTCSTSTPANVAMRARKMCPSSLGSYGRVNAQCTLTKSGEDFGNRMIREGFAVSYQRYDCGEYAELMSKADMTRSGLWRSFPKQMAALAYLRSAGNLSRQ
jgi:endonuclease YncB( thermonuclease family)